MIIDFHTHIFPDNIAQKTIEKLENVGNIKSATNGTSDGLIACMSENNITLSVNLPVVTNPLKTDSVNSFAKAVSEKYPNKILSFGGIHPLTENKLEVLTNLKKQGFLGVKIHPDYQNTFIDDSAYIEILEICASLDLVVTTHAGLDIGLPDPIHCIPKTSQKVIKAVPNCKLILAHLGGLCLFEEVYEHLAGSNVFFDTGAIADFIDIKTLQKIVDKHGAENILFASDCPWGDVKKHIELIDSLTISEDKKDMIFYKNAQKVLKV